MATSTRRRKPAPADAPASDQPIPDSAAETPAPADAAPAAPAKKARAPRKTSPARKRAAPVEAAEAAEATAPAEGVAEPAEPAAPATAEPSKARAPRPRRPRAAVATNEAASNEAPRAAAEAEPTESHADAVQPVLPVQPAAAERHAEAPADTAEAALPSAPVEQEVAAEPEPEPEPPAPPAPPLPPDSRLALEDGLQRRLRWQAGARCPETLAQAARRWQPARGDGTLTLGQVDDLAELLAIAGRTGHHVEVEPAVWQHLARLGDLQARIAHLESRHPQGLEPAAQPEGSLLAGWRPCQLEAAFFAACVGRCVLADEPALQPEAELLLAVRLVMQHFGSAAPVVQAPAEVHACWQDAWARIGDDDRANEANALTLLTPDQPVPEGTELLLLDQRSALQPAQAETPAAQAAPWLWVLAPADLLQRPEALPLLAAVDQLRQGGLAAWQRDGDADALAPLLLARRFADVAAQWPAWQHTERRTPAPADDAAIQAGITQRLARWQRSGFLADSDQLALRQALHAAWGAARAANVAALPALLREALAAGAGRIVVFSEDPMGLPALADAMCAEGLPAEALPATGAPRLADQALRSFREATGPRILLVADAPQGAESRIGVQLAAPLVIHLDTPWAAGALERRLQRVRPGPAQREVPVWQLLPEGSLMARRAQATATSDATRLDGALLRGPALAAWQAELAAVVAEAAPQAPPVNGEPADAPT